MTAFIFESHESRNPNYNSWKFTTEQNSKRIEIQTLFAKWWPHFSLAISRQKPQRKALIRLEADEG